MALARFFDAKTNGGCLSIIGIDKLTLVKIDMTRFDSNRVIAGLCGFHDQFVVACP